MSIYQNELEIYPIIPSNVTEKDIVEFSKKFEIPLKGIKTRQEAWNRLRTFIIIRNNIYYKTVRSNLTIEMIEDYMNVSNIYNNNRLNRQGKWNIIRDYNISQFPPKILNVIGLSLPPEIKQNILSIRKKITDDKVRREFQILIQDVNINRPIYSIDKNPGYYFDRAVEKGFFELVMFILNNYNVPENHAKRAFRNSLIQGYKRIYVFLFIKYNFDKNLIEMIKTFPIRNLNDIQNLEIIKRWVNLVQQYKLDKYVTKGDFIILIGKLNRMKYNISSIYLENLL